MNTYSVGSSSEKVFVAVTDYNVKKLLILRGKSRGGFRYLDLNAVLPFFGVFERQLAELDFRHGFLLILCAVRGRRG